MWLLEILLEAISRGGVHIRKDHFDPLRKLRRTERQSPPLLARAWRHDRQARHGYENSLLPGGNFQQAFFETGRLDVADHNTEVAAVIAASDSGIAQRHARNARDSFHRLETR